MEQYLQAALVSADKVFVNSKSLLRKYLGISPTDFSSKTGGGELACLVTGLHQVASLQPFPLTSLQFEGAEALEGGEWWCRELCIRYGESFNSDHRVVLAALFAPPESESGSQKANVLLLMCLRESVAAFSERTVEFFREVLLTSADSSSNSYASAATVHVYKTPPAMLQKKDRFWGKAYLNGGHGDSYGVYRRVIDGLIERAFGGIILETLERRRRGVSVGELCCGDGSLAKRLLGSFRGRIARYAMVERNGNLARLASEVASSEECRVSVLQVDVLTPEGQEALASMDPLPDVWIASGSTLNGQVGSPAMAEPTLRAMASTLGVGGFIIVTGFTVSYLNPALIAGAGLQVVEASIPGNEEIGMMTDLGQFQFFVLRKARWVVVAGGGGGDGDDAAAAAAGGESSGAAATDDDDDDSEFRDDACRTLFDALACCPPMPPFPADSAQNANHGGGDSSKAKQRGRRRR